MTRTKSTHFGPLPTGLPILTGMWVFLNAFLFFRFPLKN
jgi:hypothetical protein